MKARVHHPPTYLPEKLSWHSVGKLTLLDKGVVLKSLFACSSKETKRRNSSSARDTAARHSFSRVSCHTWIHARGIRSWKKTKGGLFIFTNPLCSILYLWFNSFLPFITSAFSTRGGNVIGFPMTHRSCEVLWHGSSLRLFNQIEAE